MRIGLIAPPWTPIPPTLYGGIELIVDELARGFDAAGHEVTLFATADSTCPVKTLSVLEHAEGMRIGVAVPELRHAIAGYKALGDSVDIIHDHTIAGPLLKHFHPVGTKVVTTIHGPFNEELLELYKVMDIPILCVSEAQRNPTVPNTKVIHHGIDPASFEVGDGKGDTDGPYCLFLGRMAHEKGAHRAIVAARKAGFRILLAAKMRESKEVQFFQDEVEPLLGPDAIYLGEVPHERKLELLRSATALLFPIRWNEPFGLVMLEAMACGTPVLAFKEGAAPEVVDHGVTGLLCDDETTMAESLASIDTISRDACRASVEGYFSSARMVKDHTDFFTTVCA